MSGSVHEGMHRWSAVLERLNSIWRGVGLTVLWFVACLPVVTAGAATVALMAVVRDDVLAQERPVVRSYLTYLRDNIRVGTVLLVTTVAPVLAVLMLWQQGDSWVMRSAWVLALLGTAAALPLTVYGFGFAAHTTQTTARALYRASVMLVLARPGGALVGLALIGFCAVAVTVWPGSLLVLAYPVARALFVTFRSAFDATAVGDGRKQVDGAG